MAFTEMSHILGGKKTRETAFLNWKETILVDAVEIREI